MGEIVDNQACSILLPLYNGALFLDDSLSSILASMRENDELVLINDGSEDISEEKLKKLEFRDSRIKIINKNHSGLVDTLNYGLRHCENELIARADIDDKYKLSRITKQAEFMALNPNCAAVFSDYQIHSMDGRNLGLIPTAISPILTRFSLLNPQRTPHPGVMFRRSAVYEVGAYSSADFPAEDLSLWIKLSKSFEISTIPETLLDYTLHRGNITSQNQNLMIKITDSLVNSIVKTFSIEAVLHDAQETFKIYDSTSHAIARKILFFRDLSKYLGLEQKQMMYFQVLKGFPLLVDVMKPNLLPTLINHRKMQKLRKFI